MLKALGASLILFIAASAEARISGGTASTWPTPSRRPFPPAEPSGPSVGHQVHQLHDKVERARDSGEISRREARQLKREARLIDRLGARYRRDGLSASEQAELQNRIHYLRSAIYSAPARSSTARAPRKGR